MSKTEAAVLAAIKADTSITAKKIAEKIELVNTYFEYLLGNFRLGFIRVKIDDYKVNVVSFN